MSRDDQQLDLFGGRGGSSNEESSSTEARWNRLTELAAALPTHVRFGTSSWTYGGWAGLVYRRTYKTKQAFVRNSLEEYAMHPLMRTVGIDRGYYGPIPAGDLRHYASQLPPGFPCAMKVWNEVTTFAFPNHPRWGERAGKINPHFLDAQKLSEHVLGAVNTAFMSNQGPIIVEIPPLPHRVPVDVFCKKLDLFLNHAPAGFHYAFEVREKSWLTKDYLAVLRRRGASHVYNYWSGAPDLRRQHKWTDGVMGKVCVLRLLQPRASNYEKLKRRYDPFDRLVEPDATMRAAALDIVADATARGAETFVLVGNKAEGCAPRTIEALATLLVDKQVAG